MGKAKKLRSTSHKKKAPPTGGPSAAELEEYASMPRDQAEMFQGLSNLQGSIREATCVTLAAMFGDLRSDEEERRAADKLKRMVENGLLRKLIPLVVDPLRMVRLHALGALRNISVTGGADVCEHMVNASVVTPLVRIIAEHAAVERFEKNDLHAVQVLEQAVALLANVCESSAAAIHELTRGNLLDAIMLIARHGRAHSALHVETLKLLLLITEGNPTLNDVFSANAQYQLVLGELIEADAASNLSLYTRLHAVGIAMNVRAIVQNPANVGKLLPIIESALAFDAVQVVQLAQQAAESWALAHKAVYDDESADLEPITDEFKEQQAQAQLKTRTWKDNVLALTLALELVADLATTGGDEDEDVEEEWASDDEEAMEQYAASQMEEASAASQQAAEGTVAHVVAQSSIYTLCVTVLQGVVSVPAIANATITADFEKIRVRVANALNNLVQQLPWAALHNDTLPQLFRNLCTLYRNAHASVRSFSSGSTSALELEAAVTSAMWAVLRRCSGEHEQLPIAADDASLIMGTALQSASVEARVNTVGLIGCVGQQTKDAAENAVVGRCLLATLNDTSLEVVTEALNAIFDVYGDEEFDANFAQLGLLPALEAAVPVVKAKLRAEQRQLDRDVAAHVKETQLNLVRFIKYKKKHLQ